MSLYFLYFQNQVYRLQSYTFLECNILHHKKVAQFCCDFYNQKFRAVVVTENQYKYLLNNEATGAKAVKILYEFEANAQK